MSEPLQSPKKRGPYVGRLHTVEFIRREICRCYKEARKNELDSLVAFRFVQILHIAARLIAGEELEKRVEVLEREKERGKWAA